MSDLQLAEETPSSPWPEAVDKWVIPYLSDSTLWPVLVALIGHVVALLALIVLAAWRRPMPIAGFGCFVILAISCRVVWTEIAFYRRPRGVTLFIVICWTIACAMAAAGDHFGVL
jgi:hypothetical protein